jgi:oxygen-dependent protoporphyrinogen oxidase
MEQLVETLESKLEKTQILRDQEVKLVEPRWKVHLNDSVLDADFLVVAVPGPTCSKLVGSFSPKLGDAIDRIPVVGSATVSLGYKAAHVPHALDGTGFVIPRKDRKRMLACTWSSQKFGGRAPKGHVLMRCFFGGAEDQQAMRYDEEKLATMAHEELVDVLGIEKEPMLAKVFHWPAANPIYEVGHLERLLAIEKLRPQGLYLTGSAFHGIGIPECVRDAKEIARGIAPKVFAEEPVL